MFFLSKYKEIGTQAQRLTEPRIRKNSRQNIERCSAGSLFRPIYDSRSNIVRDLLLFRRLGGFGGQLIAQLTGCQTGHAADKAVKG